MFCHQCNAQNLETARRCAQCGANLLGYSISDPQTFAAKSAGTDSRFYSAAWSIVAVLVYSALAVVLIPELQENKLIFGGGLLLAGIAGRLLGRAVARIHSNSF